MMIASLFASMLLFLAGCASNTVPPASVPVPLAESLGSANCASGEFRGSGIGKSEDEALNIARSDLASQINSSVKVTTERVVNQQVLNGKEDLSSVYESRTVIESALPNAHDARVLRIEQRLGEAGAVVCISRSDAAKPFIERQRLAVDSLELVSVAMLGTEHPRHKNEAWRKTQMLWNDFMKIQHLLDGWGIKSPYLADEVYSRAREDYKGYCQNAKLHWNAGREDLYSEMAFAKLSQKVKIEKSPCADRGISLVYKNSEPKCEHAGIFNCSLHPSLLIASCEGTEYRLLEGGSIMSFHQKEEVALEKLQAKLRDDDFWGEWEREIQQWRPQCE